MEETLQTVNHQSARLKSDLRVSQQERDSLKHEVALLHKQLQNAIDKVRFLFLYSKVKGTSWGQNRLWPFALVNLRTVFWRLPCTRAVCRITARSCTEMRCLGWWSRSSSYWGKKTRDFKLKCAASKETSSSPEKKWAERHRKMAGF